MMINGMGRSVASDSLDIDKTQNATRDVNATGYHPGMTYVGGASEVAIVDNTPAVMPPPTTGISTTYLLIGAAVVIAIIAMQR